MITGTMWMSDRSEWLVTVVYVPNDEFALPFLRLYARAPRLGIDLHEARLWGSRWVPEALRPVLLDIYPPGTEQPPQPMWSIYGDGR